jgi:peptidyl-prolyl cis-trans isomerase A (cyclophilin A)
MYFEVFGGIIRGCRAPADDQDPDKLRLHTLSRSLLCPLFPATPVYHLEMRRFLCLPVLFLAACSTAPPPPSKKEEPRPPVISNEQAPDTFRVNLETSKGPIVIEVTRAWAPHGADRFYNLIKSGFYDGDRFFRVVSFVVQFGINGDPSISQLWSTLTVPDDPLKQKNRRGMVTFAALGKDTRRTQVFINLKDNVSLNTQGFSPFGRVISGMNDVVDHLYFGYGDMPPRGSGPDPTKIELQGNRYLEEKFPRLDYIKKAEIQK